MKNLVALKKKNQKQFKIAISNLVKYNAFDVLRDYADADDKQDMVRKYNRKCEHYFDKFLEALHQLPKYEQERIKNSEMY